MLKRAGLCVRAGWLLAGLCLGMTAAASAQGDSPLGEPPTVEGAISAVSAGPSFDVNGKHVVTNAQTTFYKRMKTGDVNGIVMDATVAGLLVVGDNVQVVGKADRHTHEIVAEKVLLQPVYDRVSGTAVVQSVVSTTPELVVEADGYPIEITNKTANRTEGALAGEKAPLVNQWINYAGRWDKDGNVVAEHVAYAEFAESKAVAKGLEKSEPKIVEPVGGGTAGEPGKDGSIIAPYLYGKQHIASIPAQPAVQARIAAIGERLIPASQKMLKDGDPQKIKFRFYVVDEKDTLQVVGSPDGVVIIPLQIVSTLQNDDQIAAVLSQGVAEAVEWLVPPAAVGNAGPTMLAVGMMPFVAPAAGIVLMSAGLYESKKGTYPSHLDPFKGARVGLSLMHDAGYDVRQAPVAEQILRYGMAKYKDSPPTPVSAYMLKVIGLEYAHTAVPVKAGE